MSAHHIIQVSAYYPPHLGGQENAVRDLSRQLVIAGHDVTVLTSTQGGGPKGMRVEEGVRVWRLPGAVFGHAPIMPQFPGAIFRAARPSSVVHLHIGQAFTPEMVWLMSKLRGYNYIAQLHIDFEPSGPAGILLPLYKKIVLKRALRSSAAVITLNEKTLHLVRDVYGYKGQAQIMNNGIDEDFFTLNRPPLPARPPRTLRLLFVGRLSKQKNVPALLKALTLSKRKVHLDIIGEGDERAVIEETIQHLGLTNVTLHGRLMRSEVMTFYKKSDALIMPSLYEAQPLVLLEAMAARIPIIGTNVIGVVDHIKRVGIIVEPTDQGITSGIDQYDDMYAALPEMVQRGYKTAAKLRWSRTLKKYEELYDQVLES